MPPPEQFNLLSWSIRIPLGDDLWLGMQCRNIAIVDQLFIRPLGPQAIQAYGKDDRTPGELLVPLSALSQMWVFSLYEWLRTWRSRADQLIDLADQHSRTKPQKKSKLIKSYVAAAKRRERHTSGMLTYHSEYVTKIGEPAFVASLKAYKDQTAGLFSMVEALRVTLAKHEVPKSNRLVAQAPGYARMNLMTGSLYWHFINEHGGLEKIDRRELSNLFLDIDEDIEMSDSPDEQLCD
jgi:hypothetical protein